MGSLIVENLTAIFKMPNAASRNGFSERIDHNTIVLGVILEPVSINNLRLERHNVLDVPALL